MSKKSTQQANVRKRVIRSVVIARNLLTARGAGHILDLLVTKSGQILLFLFLLALPAFGTNYSVIAAGGGNFTTIQACANVMVPGDTCTVHAGNYPENVTVSAGAVGNYKTLTVNGADVVTVLSFTLGSHVKLIGNCTAPAAINTCGFNIQNPSSPGAAPCVSTPASTTDVYIVNNVMYACANGIGNSGSTSGAAIYIPQGSSFIYVRGNTVSYPAATTGNPVLTGKGIDFGEPTGGVDNVLAEGNDFSHYTLGIKYTSRHSIFRNNTFHDQIESEGSSNKHTDAFYSEQPSNVQYNVIEGNFQRNAVGANAKGTLAQGDTPCSGCTNLIIRYQVTSSIGSGVSSNYPTWPHIVQYNNTHVDLNQNGSTSGQDTDYNDGGLTNVALLNNVYFYNTPAGWSNWNSGSCGSSCNAGHNLYWCIGAGCTAPYNHIYGGPSTWTADPGNQHANPLFVNYVSPGSTSNDYHLQAGSPARNAGTNLTTVSGTITGSTSLTVADPSYFQDGYSIPGVHGDCIKVSSLVNPPVCITAVNYSTGVLTLASPISAASGDPVYLYSRSDGTVVQTDSGVDLGALPYLAGAVAPTVTTTTASSITSTSAQAGGTVTSNGGAAVTDEGTCFATTANPTTPCTHDGTATPFSSSLTGLAASTLYHYRAFATNSAGTGYGADQAFTTLPNPPTVTTRTATSVTTTSAQAGGTVTSNGGAAVTDEGTCFATTANPTTPCTHDGTATPFTSSLTGLASSTVYHYRAFATNTAGTSYGADLTFTTLTPSVCSNPAFSPTPPASAAGLQVVSLSSSCSTITYCTDTTNTCTPSTTYALGIPLDATAYVRANSSQSGFTTSATVSGLYTVTVPTVALPQNWTNSNEWIGTTTNTITLPASGSGGAWSCGATHYGPYTAGPGMCNQAVTDAEACRASDGSGSEILVPARFSCSGSGSALALPQTLGDSSNNFIVLISATPPAAGQTLCSHGIADNVAESTQPGIRNIGCNGSSMSYQVGTTVTAISPGAFTLANGTPTNTSAYDDLAGLFILECTAGSCNAVTTGPADASGVGPHHFAIIGAEILPAPGLAAPNAPVAIGQGTETAVSQIPHHIHLSYDYVHGDWTDAPVTGGVATGPPSGANSLPNGIAFKGCINCSVNYSYLDRMLRPGAEGHGIYLGLAQQIKIDHNWIEGQSINVFGGGYAVNLSIANFLNAQDVEDRPNRDTYPYSWILANAAGFCVNGLSCSGNGYVRKNCHEMKVANRYLYDGNICENVDGSGGQSGIGPSWKTDNVSFGTGTNYWIVNQNVTMTNTIMRNLCQGSSWGFRAITSSGNGGGVTLETQSALLDNNLTYNVSATNPGCTGVSNFGTRVNNNDGNTWAATAVRDSTGAYATLTLTSAPGATQSNMNVGDPVSVTGCTDPTFDTSTTGLTLALPGTSPNSLTVIYPNAGTANASTSGCTFNNLQGWPRYLIFQHNSDFINDGTNPASPIATANSSPLALSRNMQFVNSIFVGGGLSSTFGEGTRTQTQAFDANTEIFNNDLFPGRDSLVGCPGHSPGVGGMAACYTEYTSASVPITPATLYGVPASNCTGTNPQTGSCAGVLGAMSQGSFPAVLDDWHQYRLCHTGDAACNNLASLYSAGQSHQASDGTDLGFSAAAIDSAQTSILYTCATACGSGPYPDIAALSLSVSVTGLGSVSSAPLGINACTATGGTCSATFSAGSIIVLTASPGAGYQFSSWGGACSGSSLTCTVTLNAIATVSATFTLIPPTPTGTVNSRPFGVMLN